MNQQAQQETLLATSRLSVRFGRVLAVDEISFQVGRGEVYALIGRNGAGKSTVVRCLLGQLRASAGRALLFGRDAWRTRAAAMARLGVVPEIPDLPPEANAEQLAALRRRLCRSWNGELFADRLQRFGIRRRAAVAGLSKGQKRQLSLALALATEPELLILDDPTLGLDVVARKELYDQLITDLADRGTTVLLTTHDLAGVEGIASRVGIVRRGSLLLDESFETLKHRFRRLLFVQQERFDATAVAAGLQELGCRSSQVVGGNVSCIISAFDPEAVARFTANTGAEQVRIEPVSLSEIFIALDEQEEGEDR